MSTAQPTPSGPFAPFEWMLALRYLRARRREGFVSVIAIFSFIGLMLGVATLIIVMSLTNGLRQEIFEKILGLNGHIIVQPFGAHFTDYEDTAAKIAGIPGVKHSLPVVEGQVLGSGPRNALGVLVRGLRGDDLRSLQAISGNIRYGSLDEFDTAGGIAIGTRLANNLNLAVGSEITLMAPRGASTPFGTAPRVKRYPVIAIFEMGMPEYDGTIAFMPLKEAQTFFNIGDAVHVLEVLISDPDRIDTYRAAIQDVAGPNMLMNDWRQRSSAFYNTLTMQRNVMFFVVGLIVLVAAFNIISGLVMLVKDKGRGIAVLRTMGATRGAIMRVFFVTGTSIGAAGTLAGFVIGIAVCRHLETVGGAIKTVTGVNPFDPGVYFLSKLPAKTDPVEVIAIVCFSLFLSMVATLYPAFKAARLDPVEALRYE